MTNAEGSGPQTVAEIELPDFARAFALRAPRLSLLLGAGASVSSGVPSASQLVREFKREIYATETHTHPAKVASLVDPQVEETIQRHFDARQTFPAAGSNEEYAFYFERAYPDSNDRRLFIARKTEGRKPGYGYLCLGALLSEKKVRFVWTTNFEDLVEQSYSIVAEGKSASVVGRDTTSRFDVYERDERYPIVVKAHGDFRVDSLQNTTSEIAECDRAIRDAWVENCRNYGLVAVGYSGRDASVMSALSAAIDTHGSRAFPDGLYWCIREEDPRPAAASGLLQRAAAAGIRCGFVRIPDFDDFTAALYRACSLTNTLVDAKLTERQRVRRGYELAYNGAAEPILKTNAIPFSAFPERCYRFKAQVKGWADLRELLADQPIVAGLLKGHVVALARRADIESVFGGRQITDLQLANMTSELGFDDSVVIGVFYDALSLALSAGTSPLRGPAGARASRLLMFRRDHSLPDDLQQEFWACPDLVDA